MAGARAVGGSDFLLDKFALRKNLKRGCILRTPYMRRDMIPLGSDICPAHRIWHRICLRVRTDDLLPPYFPAGSFGSALKSNISDAVYEYGHRFSPHCFRRGATMELNVDVASDTQIKGAG